MLPQIISDWMEDSTILSPDLLFPFCEEEKRKVCDRSWSIRTSEYVCSIVIISYDNGINIPTATTEELKKQSHIWICIQIYHSTIAWCWSCLFVQHRVWYDQSWVKHWCLCLPWRTERGRPNWCCIVPCASFLFVPGSCMGERVATCLVKAPADSLNHCSLIVHTFCNPTCAQNIQAPPPPPHQSPDSLGIPVNRPTQIGFPKSKWKHHLCYNFWKKKHTDNFLITVLPYRLWSLNTPCRSVWKSMRLHSFWWGYIFDKREMLLNNCDLRCQGSCYLSEKERCSFCAVKIRRCLHLFYLQADPQKHPHHLFDF